MSDENESRIILYMTPDGKAQVSLMSRDGRVWLNQKQMAELFAVTKMNISHHIAAIIREKELDESVVKYCFTTAADGKRYKVIYYALEMILAVGHVGYDEAVKVSDARYDEFDARRKQEEARLADEADLQELLKIEEEAKRRG